MYRWTLLAVVVCSFVSLVGCGGCGTSPPPKQNGKDPHGHSHDQPGPHSGKLLAIGAEEYHAEFVMDDATGKVTVYLLDKAMKVNDAATSTQAAIRITAKSKTGERDFDLAAVGRTDEKPAVNQFEVVDKELVGLLTTLGGDATAQLSLFIADKPFSQKIDFEAHGHDHDH